MDYGETYYFITSLIALFYKENGRFYHNYNNGEQDEVGKRNVYEFDSLHLVEEK
jgi:hypothetical protein